MKTMIIGVQKSMGCDSDKQDMSAELSEIVLNVEAFCLKLFHCKLTSSYTINSLLVLYLGYR